MPATAADNPPNIFTNEMFLRAAFGPEDWGRVKVAHFMGDPERQPRSAWQGFPAEDMLKAPHEHLNTYFSVGVQNGSSRGLAGFEAICVIVLDDIGTKVDLGEAEALLGTAPSYVMETSPGNCQAGWFVEPIASREWALGLVQALYEALGRRADNLKNLVGYMRLPVGTNGKAKHGPGGWRVKMRRWAPGVRIGALDWPEIERRIGGVKPVEGAHGVGAGSGREMPDPGEIEADALLQAFRLLGLVQGTVRRMTMGWGFDVDCPWLGEHSERVHEGASYVPVHGRFHCHHGHCQERTTADVRVRLDELLREGGFAERIAGLEFDDLPEVEGGQADEAASEDEVRPPVRTKDDSEDGLAQLFFARHEHELRYDHSRGAWFVWTGGYWRKDATQHALKLAGDLARDFRAGLIDAKPGLVRSFGKHAFAVAIERAARTYPRFAMDGSLWDRDPTLVGAPGCEIDLRTGAIRPPEPAHLITKQLLVTPRDMPTPLWDRFLWDATGGDPDTIAFLQAWSGYCLTGDTSEEKFVFVFGPGGNGKGTFLHTISAIMNNYAARAPADMFMIRKHEAHPEEIARLAGTRAVTVSEIEEGRTFNIARLKDLTGRDGPQVGAFKYGHTFEYMPQFKITFVGNHQPRLTEVDDALRRRLILVPFTQKPSVVDTTLKDQLAVEYPGILRWMIQGEINRQQAGGLSALVPAAAAVATESYLEDQDTLQRWAEERCVFSPDGIMTATEGWNDYRSWCYDRGEHTETGIKDFRRKFVEKFPVCEKRHTNRGEVLRGVSLILQDV